jgi:transcriptional regulator with XRE-family HTH domain
MSHVGVLQIEAGERSPQLRALFKLAEALDLRPSKVLEDIGR